MKTFTVRDLDRTPALVLRASEADGVAAIQSRDGRRFEIRPVAPIEGKSTVKDAVARHLIWMKSTYTRPISAEHLQVVDAMVSEER